jgi:signal transduction histidine kinase
MKRSWQAWLSYAACLAVALPALAWLSFAVLDVERAERTARDQAQRDERIRLASWRLDTMLMPIIAAEAARSYDDYAPYLSRPAPQSAAPAPTSKYLIAYFEISPDGWRFSRLFAAGEAGPDTRRMNDLQQTSGYDKLLAQLPSEWLPADVNSGDQNLVYLNRGANPSRPEANQASQAQAPQVDDEFLRRQQANRKATAREMVQQRAAKSTPFGPPNVREGISRTLWVGDELLVARRVQINDTEVVQGAWLDWPKLRAAMQAEVADLLPHVTLLPVKNEAGVNFAHALAVLPVQLVLPPATANVTGRTPLRVALVVAWAGLLAVAAAAAVLLAGMISLGERREAFVSAVTHELRTPLTTFRMYAEMLGSGMVADESKRQEYLRTLKVEADRLWHLVENVLAYARLERTRPAHRFERLALGELWDRVEPRLSERARAAGMVLSFDVTASSRGTLLLTDPSAVEQILFNLVDNACKYAARAAPPAIQVHATVNNGHVEVRVRDHGAGIAPADARRLFRPFSKSAERAATSAPGVGLGLALCRQLARQLRGDLRYEPGQGGTTFVLCLPRS